MNDEKEESMDENSDMEKAIQNVIDKTINDGTRGSDQFEAGIEIGVRAGYLAAKSASDLALQVAYQCGHDKSDESVKDEMVCGQRIQFGNFLVGCGRPINHPEIYRCYECDNAFHKHCLKQHCTERKHGVTE